MKTLADTLMEELKEYYQELKERYHIPYRNEYFDIAISETDARLFANVTETVITEIMRMREEGIVTAESIKQLAADTYEKHKNDKAFKKNIEQNSQDTKLMYELIEGLYPGGRFASKIFDDALEKIAEINGDDPKSPQWRIFEQPMLYSAIYSVLDVSVNDEAEQEHFPEFGGSFLLRTLLNLRWKEQEEHQSPRYRITSPDDIKTEEEFTAALTKYVLDDSAWQMTEDFVHLYPKDTTGQTEEERQMIQELNRKFFHSDAKNLEAACLVLEFERADHNNVFTRFSVKGLWDDYQTGGWNRVHRSISEARKQALSIDMDTLPEIMADYEKAAPYLILRPLNFPERRYDIMKSVYERIGDVAIVLYLIIADKDGVLTTTKITKEIFQSWNREKDEIMQAALSNSMLQAPPRLYTDPKDIENIFDLPYSKGVFMALNPTVTSLRKTDVPVLTTTRTTNGAMALFYPGVMEKLAQLYDDSYYVVFTASSEARLHCNGTIRPIDILRNVKSVNKQFPDEALSNKVFFYDREQKKLEALEL